jgi:hypothetical protein
MGTSNQSTYAPDRCRNSVHGFDTDVRLEKRRVFGVKRVIACPPVVVIYSRSPWRKRQRKVRNKIND